MGKNNLTYQRSGVNIKEADKFIKYISHIAKITKQNKKSNNIGGFGSISNIPTNIKNPKLVASTDGVGTKIEIANTLNKYDTIGIDLVAMSVNDLIVQGARPIFFLDYIAINKIKLNKTKKIIKGIVEGCKLADCALIGGETAEMPGTYSKNKFDLAGFAVGLVEKKKLLTKNLIKKDDIVLAVPSSGLHSNGFSLIRHVLKKKENKIPMKIKKELLKPTKIYVKEINKINRNNLINGCANITGGGILGNIIRVIPENLCANIDLSKIKIKPIFKWLKNRNVSDSEMLKTFNCGVGFCLIANKNKINKIKNCFPKEYKPYQIGYISKGKNKIKSFNKIKC